MSAAMKKLILSVGQRVQQRSMSAISAPPTEKMSTAETVILGGVLVGCWTVTPIWVLTHIKHYQGRA